jgi:hypothetical protein
MEEWGVEVLGVRFAMSGYMLDFRMRVIDPEKAAPLFVRKTKPVLIDEATGEKLAVASTAKTGPLRSSNIPQAGRNYPIVFNNSRHIVKAGSLVTVVIGYFRVEHLEVR